MVELFEVKSIDLSRELYIDKPSLYDTINEVSISRMKIYKMKDEIWAAGRGDEGDFDDE